MQAAMPGTSDLGQTRKSCGEKASPPFTQNREPPTFWRWEQPMPRKRQSAKRPRWMFFALPRLLPRPTAAKGALAEGVSALPPSAILHAY